MYCRVAHDVYVSPNADFYVSPNAQAEAIKEGDKLHSSWRLGPILCGELSTGGCGIPKMERIDVMRWDTFSGHDNRGVSSLFRKYIVCNGQ